MDSDKEMDHNVFEILGVERRELSYSNFLAWLMDPGINGNVGVEFLEEFLCLVDRKYSLTNTSICVDREEEKENSIADIVVESEKFLVVIENKVKSAEGKEQTVREYKDWEGSDKDEIFVYLTPEYREDCERDEFKHITYTQIREVLEDMDKSDFEKRTKIMIEDFIETLEVNNLVKFDGFKNESKEYMKKMKEIGEKENIWKKERDNLFNEVENLLEKEEIFDDNWNLSNKKDRIRIAKKGWDKGLSIKCILNDNAVKGGYVKLAIYAIKKDVDDRKRKWKKFYKRYDGKHKSTKYKWVEEKDSDLFDEILSDEYKPAERIKDKLSEYINKYANIIDEATS